MVCERRPGSETRRIVQRLGDDEDGVGDDEERAQPRELEVEGRVKDHAGGDEREGGGGAERRAVPKLREAAALHKHLKRGGGASEVVQAAGRRVRRWRRVWCGGAPSASARGCAT